MAVLVVPGDHDAAEAVVRRLIAQGDDVRVVEGERSRRESWVELGAHVAVGDATDPDLIERAAQGVRTVVVLGSPTGSTEVVAALLEGGPRAGIDRVVMCAEAFDEDVRGALRTSGLGYALLSARSQRILRPGVDESVIAAAVDAADDLAGEIYLELDLGDRGDRSQLGI